KDAAPRPATWAGAARSLGHAALSSSAMGWFVTFNTFSLAAIFFRAQDLTMAMDYFRSLLSFSPGVERCTPFVALLIVFSVATQFLPRDLLSALARLVEARGPIVLGLLLGGGMLAIETIGPGGIAPFIYFQF